MDYQYDIFYSYKRNPHTLHWNRWVRDKLVFWLTQEIGGRKINCFMDEQSIETGEHWPESLQTALKHSRCLVGVWSPEYFQSEWCVSEWKTFVEREKCIQRVGLIAPIRHIDGEHFPPDAQIVQSIDVREFNSTVQAFLESKKAIKLETRIKELAMRVASIINGAPEFDATWPSVPTPQLNPAPKIGLPRL